MKIDPRLSLKGLKTWTGREGPGYSFTLLINGRAAAVVRCEGDGGDTWFDWDRSWPEGKAIWGAILTACPLAPPDPPFPEMEMSSALLAAELADQYETLKKLKRLCKTKTVFGLKSEPGQWSSLPLPYNQAVKHELIQHHGDDLDEIFNERFSK
jgi:hypothetical protein